MTFLRNVLHDLVEKRLWPVAVALIVALVAVPVVLGGSEEPVAPVDDVAAVTPEKVPPGSAEVVSLDQNVPTGKVARTGKVRNPFKQQHLPKTDTAGAASSLLAATRSLLGNSSSPSSPSTGGSSPSGGGGGIQSPTPSPTPTAPKPDKPDPKDLYRVTLRFGEVGDLKTHKNVARLTPLPSSSNPFVVFLGIKADGKTAVFLVSSDAVPSGDGKCRPSTRNCESLELQAGDTELLDLQTGTAGVVQYRLDLRAIDTVMASQAKASKAHARESSAGREWLRLSVSTDPTLLDGWRFSKRLGVLVERTEADQADDVAHLPAGLAEAAAGEPAP
jgi:hypothetical protein